METWSDASQCWLTSPYCARKSDISASAILSPANQFNMTPQPLRDVRSTSSDWRGFSIDYCADERAWNSTNVCAKLFPKPLSLCRKYFSLSTILYCHFILLLELSFLGFQLDENRKCKDNIAALVLEYWLACKWGGSLIFWWSRADFLFLLFTNSCNSLLCTS